MSNDTHYNKENDMEFVFSRIYNNNGWGNNNNDKYNGSSGWGSSINYNKETYIPFLKKFITENNIKSVVDFGCGDFVCGSMIYDDLDITYTGYDAYDKVITYLNETMSSQKYTFYHSDFYENIENIKEADLCILKDVLQHWRLEYIYTFLDYLVEQKKFKYILICNCCIEAKDNVDILLGNARHLSCDFFPLKKYNPTKLFNYDTKEISIIQIR